MQCNHPFYGYPIFKQNDYVPWFPPPTSVPAPSPASFPEVVGEGEVTSMMYPDGSQQYFFLPKNFGTGPYFYKNNSIWLIRSICLPNYNQQNNYDTQMSQPACGYPTNENSITGFQLKFHSDNGTSTTDLHYFFPSLRTCEWVPRLFASVQAELPIESPAMNHYHEASNYHGSYGKLCNYNNTVNQPKRCSSSMSVDNASETNMQKPVQFECKCKEIEEKIKRNSVSSNKQISFSDKTNNTVKETPKTCNCHGEESNAPDYKCDVAEQRNPALLEKKVEVKCECDKSEHTVKEKHITSKCHSEESTAPFGKNTKDKSECDKSEHTVKERHKTCKCHGEETTAPFGKNTRVKSECVKSEHTVKERHITCKCHGEENKCKQRSAAPYDKKTKVKCEETVKDTPITCKCYGEQGKTDQCKTAVEKDMSNHKFLCRTASICSSCRNKKMLNLRRHSKCLKSRSSSSMDKHSKCECHMDTDKKSAKQNSFYDCDEHFVANRDYQKMSDVSGNCSENTLTNGDSASRTSLCDVCCSLCEWYDYLFSKDPPTDNTKNSDHSR